jgi:hypothetical protein
MFLSSVDSWGTMLLGERSRVRVPLKWMHFSIYLILPASLDPGVYSAFNRNEYQKIFLGAKHGRSVRLTTLPPSESRLALTSPTSGCRSVGIIRSRTYVISGLFWSLQYMFGSWKCRNFLSELLSTSKTDSTPLSSLISDVREFQVNDWHIPALVKIKWKSSWFLHANWPFRTRLNSLLRLSFLQTK